VSRIGVKPIEIPQGVEVTQTKNLVAVKGPKGNLSAQIHSLVEVKQEDNIITVTRVDESNEARALHGLSRALVANMVEGVVNGYSKTLEIQGVGFRVAAKGPSTLEFSLGFSHSVPFTAPEGIEFKLASPTQIEVSGIDKQMVGQVAANIRKLKPPEPYKGKGIRYTGEVVRRKAGKSAK
jgi:large subunit ribosomal protein L6